MRIIKAENGFVLVVGEDLGRGKLPDNTWIAKDAGELARVIITAVVAKQLSIDVPSHFESELDSLLKDINKP